MTRPFPYPVVEFTPRAFRVSVQTAWEGVRRCGTALRRVHLPPALPGGEAFDDACLESGLGPAGPFPEGMPSKERMIVPFKKF